MRIGFNPFLTAVGAMLWFAINTTNHKTYSVNVGATGVILMIVGAAGLSISALWMWAQRPEVVTRGLGGTAGTTYVELADPNYGVLHPLTRRDAAPSHPVTGIHTRPKVAKSS